MMDISFTPEVEARLNRIASETGRGTDQVIQEAVERFVEYDEWFVGEVDKGLAQADSGEVIEHGDVVSRIEKHLREKQMKS